MRSTDELAAVLCGLFALSVIFAALGLFFGIGKNRAIEGAVLGLLLGPIGLVVLMLLGRVYKRRCPYCLAGIPDFATRCRHCAADLSPEERTRRRARGQ
jgi:hypothetical protein